MKFNPFMRVDKDSIKKATGKQDPIEVMAALREMKNISINRSDYCNNHHISIHEYETI